MGQVIHPAWQKVPPVAKAAAKPTALYRFISTQRGCRIIVSKYLSCEQMMQLSYEIFLKAREMEVSKSKSSSRNVKAAKNAAKRSS